MRSRFKYRFAGGVEVYELNLSFVASLSPTSQIKALEERIEDAVTALFNCQEICDLNPENNPIRNFERRILTDNFNYWDELVETTRRLLYEYDTATLNISFRDKVPHFTSGEAREFIIQHREYVDEEPGLYSWNLPLTGDNYQHTLKQVRKILDAATVP